MSAQNTARLPVSIACWDYDRTRHLMDGRIGIEGCTATFAALAPEEMFFRAFRNQEFDISELSLATYIMSTSRGACPYIAIPVFPSRAFRHNGIYVRTDRGIKKPEDLKGKKIGAPEYQLTACVWIRGILQDEYGVKPSDSHWFTGGIEEPGRHEKVTWTPPAGVSVTQIGPEQTLSAMLAAGEIDAIIGPRAPSCFTRKTAPVDRLFPDFKRDEQAYYKKTGIFPPMHAIGIRKSLVEKNPWLPASVFKAFVQAKAATYLEQREVAAFKFMLPWFAADVEEARRVLGEDFWPYGVAPNVKSLEALTRYCFEQGMATKKLELTDLFAPSTLETAKI